MRRFACLLIIVVATVLSSAASGAAAVPTLTAGSPHLAGWTGPITVTVTADVGDDPTDTYTILWDGSAGAVEPSGGSGNCQTMAGQPALSCQLVSAPKVGSHVLELRDDLASTSLKTVNITIQPHLSSRLVKLAPLTFTPFKLDHITDKLNMTFILNKVAGVQFQVRNKSGSIVRHSTRKSYNFGRHIVRWAGANDHGRLVTPNLNYWVRLVSTANGETVTGDWHKVFVKKVVPPPATVPPTRSGCVAAYPTHCFPKGPDLDCSYAYARHWDHFKVLRPDPYNFDADHDGIGCESPPY